MAKWESAPVVEQPKWASAPVLDGGPVKPVKLGAEGLPDAIKDVAGNFSGLSKAAIGAAGAVNKAAMRLKQLVGRDLTPEDIQGLNEYKALEEASGAAVAGDIGMSILSTLQPATALYKAGTAAASRVLPRAAQFLAPTVGAALSGGAITTATTPDLDGVAAETAGMGALGAAAADAATRGAARVVRPVVQSAPVQRLMREGVVPTIGQSAGGFINRVEQQLESVPLVGWMISHSRGRAVKEMNEAAIRKALPPNATSEVIKAGREGIERAGALIDNAYDAAYGRITGKVKVDDAFRQAVNAIPKTEGVDLPPSLEKRFLSLLKDRVLDRLKDGANAETVRAAHNSLGALSRRYRASADPDQRALGQAFAEAKGKLREMVSRQSGGEFKATLDALDKKYSNLLAVEKASGYQGSKDGIFSAESLKRASSKSSSEMREFAGESADVLGRTVPDSGTAGRALLPLAAVAAGAGGNEYLGGPSWLTGALAASLLYSRFGSRYASGGFPFQQGIADILRASSPLTSQVGRELANQ